MSGRDLQQAVIRSMQQRTGRRFDAVGQKKNAAANLNGVRKTAPREAVRIQI
jgi:hypothetical protein